MRVLVARGRISFLLVGEEAEDFYFTLVSGLGPGLSMSNGIAPEKGIPRLWDNAVPVSHRTGKYIVHSSTP